MLAKFIFLAHIALFAIASYVATSKQGGGIIRDKNITFTRQSNPIVITKDIVIKRGAKLTIEAGSEVVFERGKGILVYGTLEILGQSNDKVRLSLLKTSPTSSVNFRSHGNNPIAKQQVRLVDGDSPNEGRIQIKLNDRWHSLCTSSKNLTATDIKVLCRQTGYREGAYYRWFPKRNDTTLQVMSKSFECSGTEKSIEQCARWNRLRVGGGICDGHSDLGIRCSKTLFSHDQGFDYWKGIEFINSEHTQELVLEGTLTRKVSKSIVRHVVITQAGMNEVGNATAAVQVFGQPPTLDSVDIRDSVYGIMVEEVDDAISMRNIRLTNNLGSPIFVNTSWGKVELDSLHIEDNKGDAIRIVKNEKFIVGSHDFCKFANLGLSQVFPVTLSHEQTFFTAGQECCQEFTSNNQLTVHFPVLRSTPNNLLPEADKDKLVSIPSGINIGRDAHLVVYDDYRDEFSFRLKIHNGTRAQSIVSRSGRLKICYEPANFRTVLFTLQVVTNVDDEWTGKARDVEISNTYLNANDGRGIWVDNQKSGVKIVNTTVTNHNHIGGVHLENGTGEVIILGSRISNNFGHGVYINLAGGYFHIDNSTISDNSLKGVFIEYDSRPELVAFNHTFHIGYSLLAKNGENGLFIGNMCRPDAFWNVSMNSIIMNGEDAVLLQSCPVTAESLLRFKQILSRSSPPAGGQANQVSVQELLITHNSFLANARKAITIVPINFLKLSIRHNQFRNHPRAVIHIANRNRLFPQAESEDQRLAPTNVRIASNRFYANSGRYVANIGVQEDNSKQSLVFTKNYLEGNMINEPYSDLRPRSRVSAVVVVSSSNTRVIRNRFDNPQSSYDMGSHVELHWKVINATANFWGLKSDAGSIYKRIFDRKNRYNLAQIEFLQYLLNPDDLEYATDLSFDRERDKISTFRDGSILGGEVKGLEELPKDSYIVENDIFVRPGAHLVIRPGSNLKFKDSVGIMVQGRLDALGLPNAQIVFTSASHQLNTTRPTESNVPQTKSWSSEDFEDPPQSSMNNPQSLISEKRASISKRQASSQQIQTVRLSHSTMGRLEVNIDGNWGPVCDYEFDIDDAAVACQQLGLVVNEADWLLERFQFTMKDNQESPYPLTNAMMTNIRCDPAIDTDITKCKAELSTRRDFDGLCNLEVGIRCFPPSWSGLRLGMGAETSTLEHMSINRAGLYDYATYTLKPALRVDFFKHLISFVTVRASSDSGLGIMMTDIIGRHFSDLLISDSKFTNNERHGIELRSRGLTIRTSHIQSNRQNGIDYDPTFSQNELEDLLSWLHASKFSDRIVNLKAPLKLRVFTIPSSEDSFKFFIIQKSAINIFETFTISTDPGHMLSIQLINPIHPNSSDDLNMTLGMFPESPLWNFRINMTSFPMVSAGYRFNFNYSSGSLPHGNIVLYIRSRYNNRDLKLLTRYIPPHLVMNKFDQIVNNINSKLINSLTISQCNITKNGIGLKFRHANLYFGTDMSYNTRYCNESTNITNNLIEANYFSSIYVSVDDPEPVTNKYSDIIPASEIAYNVIGNKMRRNRDGIRQFVRDGRFTSNVFHWLISDTTYEDNKGGGLNIFFPYYWHYDSNMSHTIEISNNIFQRNNKFEFSIDGHFTVLNMSSNGLRDNRCRRSLVTFAGMEKRMMIRDNLIESNICGQIVEFLIHSHADKFGSVSGSFEFNVLRYNRKPNFNTTSTNYKHPKLLNRLHPLTSDFTLNIDGLQHISLKRNIFLNPELRFELLVSARMDASEIAMNATENYWGSTRLSDIKDRIFDFDDWNIYSTVEINPILVLDSVTSATVNVDDRSDELFLYQTLDHLGGRLTRNTTLKYRKEPYIVESDLTVMPNVKLIIERGVVMEFMPNVVILVLGDLIAAGSRDQQIVMRPFLSEADMFTIKPRYLLTSKLKPHVMQTNLDDPLSFEHNYAFQHYKLAYPVNLGSVRLCKNEICSDGNHIYDNNVEDPTLRQEALRSFNNTWKIDGFLEVFNTTTLQWVPICDPLFSEYNAKVVCRQLGYSQFSIHKRGRRQTIEYEQISRIRSWPPSLRCAGYESALSSCPLLVHSSTNHSTYCNQFGNQHTYVYCEESRDSSRSSSDQNHVASYEFANFWGGIRFSCPASLSLGIRRPNLDLIHSFGVQSLNDIKSRLQYVSIDRAGMSHLQRSPAIQILQCNVQLEYVTITNSAHHGLEVITSQANHNFHQLRIVDNLGVGFYYASLTGSSSSNRITPYLPLKSLDISEGILGMINICGLDKEISIEDRAFIFFRYTSQPIDCLKIISSRSSIKHLRIRMLQFNLFNSTSYTSRPDSLKVYDGNIFDRDSKLLVDFGVTERHRIDRPELKFHQTNVSTMTIRLHVSGATSYHGFIAEVISTPVSYTTQKDTFSNITFSEISGNKLGALALYNAGESSPHLILRHSRFERNCIHLFGNFTSCPNPLYMELQNCPSLKFTNNLVRANQGGLSIKSYSHTPIAALDGIIERNIFEGNLNTNTLSLFGPKTDPYQTFKVDGNFFTRNLALYLANIVLSRVIANFSENIISSNIGKHQIEVIGFDKLPLSYQTFVGNWIYNNSATFEPDRSTIFGNSAGQRYVANYIVNLANYYEISTYNWSRYDQKPFHAPRDDEIIHLMSGDGSSRDYMRKTADAIPFKIIDTKQADLYHATIDAKRNWWGFSSPTAVTARIRDQHQHVELIKVESYPHLETNKTLLSDICSGGWRRVGGACLLFIGTRMTYQEAKNFCDSELSTLPLLRGNHYEFADFIKNQEREYDPKVDRIWMRSFDVSRDACPALNDYRTRNYACQDRYAFLCEKDPQVVVSLLHWHRETGGLLAITLALITASLTFCCTLCWAYKSHQRHKEKLDRKSSIYATLRTNRGPYSSANSLIELGYPITRV